MLTPWDFHKYQVTAVKHGLHYPQAMYWLDMGLGKTVIAQTVINERIDRGEVFGAVVFAPLRVCQTVWEQEARNWQHLQHLHFSLVHGTPVQRTRAMQMPADIYLVNYENIAWFAQRVTDTWLSKGKYPPFNMFIFDEVSMLKDAGTKRHAALRGLLPFVPFRLGLTGTPASNGYKDLHGQYLAVDSGRRLGVSKRDYRERWFHQAGQFNIEPDVGAEDQIHAVIADITMEMSADDYLEMPETIFNDIYIDLPPAARKLYDELEEEMFVQLDDNTAIEVFNAAALSTKCRQAANGALYVDPDRPGVWSRMHDTKLDALDDIVEEAGGQPILLMHEFQHDAERIRKRYPFAEFITDHKGQKAMQALIARWNAGEIRLLVGHPKSAGHGLNLQYGGHIMVWFGLNWSLELYAQAIARLARQGQKYPVIVHRLLCRKTMDEAVAIALQGKAVTERGLRDAIKQYRASLR